MTKRSLIVLLTVCASVIGARAQGEDPDFKKEEYFHKVYKTYNEHPTSAEAWEKALSNRKASTYTIQNKDTLWDVSQTFFGDSNYWPKVWSYNTEGILNPHEINPKQAIRFYAGNFSEPPTVGLADKNAEPEALPNEVIEKLPNGKVETIKLPPPKRKSRPLVKHLPDSIPLYRLAVNTPPIEFEAGQKPTIPTPQHYLSVYVVDRDVAPVGEVLETEIVDGQSASEFQYITVHLNNANDKNLVAYSDASSIKEADRTTKATVVQVQGEIEVLERVGEGDNVYRAMVKKTINPVMVGAKLMVGKMQMFEVRGSEPTTSVQARIIGGEPERYQKIFGDDEFIFLSAGAQEGLQEGSTLQVYMNEVARKIKTKTVTNDRRIGLVKIVKLADHYATAFILKAEMDMVVGDYVGGSVKASALAPVNPGAADSDFESELNDATAPPKEEAPPAEAPATGDSVEDDFQL